MEMKVLIVDDSPMIRRWIIRSLMQIGFSDEQLHEASNGQQALAALGEQEFDLVLLDLHMPVLDGETFVRVVRTKEEYSSLEIVIVSTESNEQRLETLRKHGVCKTLRKPFEPADLQQIVRDVELRKAS